MNNDRLRVLRTLIPVVALALGAAAPPGWVERPRQTGPSRAYDSRTSAKTSVIVLPAPPPGAGIAASIMVKAIGSIPQCPPLAPSPGAGSGGATVLRAVAADRRCIALIRPGATGDRAALGLAIGPGSMTEAALTAALAAFVDDGTPVAAAAPVATPARDRGPSVIARSGPAPRPVGAVMRGENEFLGSPPMLSYKVSPWFLFDGGIATDCARVDPAALQLTLAALRAQRGCTGARWRKAGGKVEMQIDDDDEWSSDGIFQQPPVPRGTKLDFRGITRGGVGFDSPFGNGGTSSLSSGGFVLTRDGRIETEMSSSVSFSSPNAVASSSRRRAGVRGRYELDGYVIRIALDEGPTIERYILFDKGGAPTYEHVYFEDKHFWLPKRR